MKRDISFVVESNGEKAVIIGHSMGANVALYFMKWADHHDPGWVDQHIDTFLNIGGAILGAFAPLAAFVSGEMDGSQMFGPFGQYVELEVCSWVLDEIGLHANRFHAPKFVIRSSEFFAGAKSDEPRAGAA